MTAEFDKAVEHYCEGYTVAPGCRGDQCEHSDSDENHSCEPSFSWSPCDSCGTTLGGDREPASMIPNNFRPGDDTIIEVSICTDCVLAWANGESPDNWSAAPISGVTT